MKWMRRIPPAVRLAMSLAVMTVGILVVSDLFGLFPDRNAEKLATRAVIAESLAVQVSAIAARRDATLLSYTLRQFVERNKQVLSAGFRAEDGELVSEFGDHQTLWRPPQTNRSTPTHLRVPVFHKNRPWGTVEIRFQALDGPLTGLLGGNAAALLAFVGLSGFLLYALFLRRALTELNPSRVIPGRVQAAFDVLSEGVLVLDEAGRIMLANEAVARAVSSSPEALVGQDPKTFGWEFDGEQAPSYPWLTGVDVNDRVQDVQMRLYVKGEGPRTFSVNSAPVTGPSGEARGTLVTFDDMSSIERTNDELRVAMAALEQSRVEIEQKNLELVELATRDPLTGCMNRRALFEQFDPLFAACAADGRELVCFMVDIDHFKSVNDRFGHSVGDEVIKAVARVLMATSGPQDLIGRYGGEEFCVVSPGASLAEGMAAGERFRRAISVLGNDAGANFPLMRVTASIGVAAWCADDDTPLALVNRADQALYVAKGNGRNKVEGHDPSRQLAQAEPEVPAFDRLPGGLVQGGKLATSGAEAGGPLVEVLKSRVQELEMLAEERAREVWHQSLHDGHTGLPNRVLLLDRATQAVKRVQRHGVTVAAVAVRIDDLGRVNNALGREVGDELLKEVAERLSDAVRNTDTVSMPSTLANASTLSRVGGNEFIVLLSELVDEEAVDIVVSRIKTALNRAFVVRDQQLLLTGRLGVSVFAKDAMDAEGLMAAADIACSHAESGQDRISASYYSDDLNKASVRRLAVEGRLLSGIDNGELSLVYQPKIDLGTMRICGVEALVRWDSPDLGSVSPGEFIPVAEESNLMERVTEWVLTEACAQVKAWGPLGFGDVRMAINISAVELRDRRLAARLLTMIHQQGVEPRQLEIEVTETAIVDDIKNAAGLLTKFRRAGVLVSLDDFGTGYSSLQHLTALPVDVLKVDRCFISGIESSASNQALLKGMVAIGRAAGLKVLAEGVETAAELEVLQRLQFDEVQGYLLGKPMGGELLTGLLLEQSGSGRNRWLPRVG